VVLVSARTVAAVVLTLSFLVPLAATASPAPASHQARMPTLADVARLAHAWTSPSKSYGVSPYAAVNVPNGTQLRIFPLGDVDADKHDDLVYANYDKKNAMTLEVRSGADLSKVLWTVKAADAAGFPAGDVNGDGIQDVGYEVFQQAQQVGTAQSVVVAFVMNGYGYTAAFETHFLSGKDGSEVLKLPGSFSFTESGAFGLALFLWSYDYNYDFLTLPSPKNLVDFDFTSHYTFGDVCPVLTCAFVSNRDHDLGISFMDDKGTKRGTVDRTDKLTDVQTFAMGEMTGDRNPDAVVAELQGFGGSIQGNDVPVSKAMVTVFGNDGKTAWSVVKDPALNLLVDALPAGDLDGDGKSEVAFLEVTVKDAQNFHSSLMMLSGADGAQLGSLELDNSFALVTPFGPGPSGKNEGLLVQGSLFGSDTIKVSPVGADLKPRWTQDVGRSFPINAEYTADGATAFADWNGDHLPDLATADFSGNYPDAKVALRLVDGATGKDAWTGSYDGALELAVLPDMTGKGSSDVVVGQQSGAAADNFAGATVSFTALAGEDGGALYRQVVRQPNGPAGQPGGLNMTVTTAGDVTGDGLPDVLVRVEEATPKPDYETFGDFTLMVGQKPGLTTWYVMAANGAGAVPNAAVQTSGATGADGKPLPTPAVLPPAQDLSSGRPAPQAARPAGEEAHKSPGLELPILGLALLALGLAGRRRHA